MRKELYDLMDWGRIEGVVYSEENQPHDFLGATVTEAGVLVQTFLPSAVSVTLTGEGISCPMEKVDENGFFAALLPGNKIPDYRLEITQENTVRSVIDPYNYEPQIPPKALKKFRAGNCHDIYNYLGAHPATVSGLEGMSFAVWAPNAVRVSLVGDFNGWDGRVLPMRKLEEYGVFVLFVPEMKEGTLYKYEIKAQTGLTFLKSDPYGFQCELRPGTASVTTDLSSYSWGDQAWMEERSGLDTKSLPVSIYQIHAGTWRKPTEEGKEFFSYKELAKALASYVKEMGYTHVELLPVMEHTDDKSMGYATSGFYAPTSRYGSAKEFMYFVDYLHQHQIGVILDWAPGHFSRELSSLIGFDGTNLYEHKDPRQSLYAYDGSLTYNYARSEVKNFLIANALFWAKVYHADALRLEDISRMLYLDYGKTPGQWVANLYGGNENLDAVEFFRDLNTVFHQESCGAFLIAQDSSQWPMVTGPSGEEGLGFDYKWNKGFQDSLIDYMQLDPIFRGAHHSELIFSMVYNYSENFLLALDLEVVSGKEGSMYSQVPGRKKTKLANLRAMYGYMMVHPGKKLFAMGCELAQKAALKTDAGVDWNVLEEEENLQFRSWCVALLKFYRENPALYALDYDPDGFEWINNISANENMLVFVRRSSIEEETLLVVVNFSNLTYENHKIGVPFSGKYKEILNSDAIVFGGDGHVNPRVRNSREDECDELPDSIRITVPALGICIFRCTRLELAKEEEEAKSLSKGKNAAAFVKKAGTAKTSSGKKLGAAKNASGKKTAEAKSKADASGQGGRKKTLKETLEEKVQEEDYR